VVLKGYNVERQNMKKLIVIGAIVATLAVGSGVAIAQNSGDGKAKAAQITTSVNESIQETQPVESDVTVATPETVVEPKKTGASVNAQSEPVEEEPAPVTLVSTYRCGVTTIMSSETVGGVTRTNSDSSVYTIKTYSDGSVTVDAKAHSVVSGLVACEGNVAPQPVSL
jgi:hypothetical protein